MAWLQKYRTIFIIEGILFCILAMIAIILPGLTTLGITLIVGWLLVFGAIIHGYKAFKSYQQPGFYPSLFSSLFTLIIGIVLLVYPITGMVTLTLLLIAYFFIEGIAKLIFAFQIRPRKNWGWLAFSGFLALVLGAIIWSGLPGTAVWAIGLMLGINMLFFGISLLMLGSVLPNK